MSKIGIITKFEIVRQLKKPSFWVALLLMPLLLGGIMGISALSGYHAEESMDKRAASSDEAAKISVIDHAGVIDESVLPQNVLTDMTKEEGIELIKKGELDELYVIEKDFVETKKVEAFVRKKDDDSFSLFSSSSNGNISSILTASAATRVKPADIVILSNSIEYTKTILDGNGEEVNLLGKAIIPIAVLAIFYVLICVFGNRMLMAVVEEKENRISEMILTSATSKQLIIGKIFALITLGFLQMVVFSIPVIIAAIIYRDNAMVSGILGSIELDPATIIGNVLLLVASYLLFTGASTFVGSLMPTARDASQYIGVVMVGMVLPLMFFGEMVAPEPSMMVYFLSYFPLSSPIAMMLRNAFGLLPWYEFIFGIIEISLCSIVVIYFASRSFQKNAINFSIAKLPIRIRRRK